MKVACFDVRVHRADDDGFIFFNLFVIMEVGGSQGNGGEGVPAARLYTDVDLVSQLIADRGNLAFGSGNGNGSGWIYRANLLVNPLNHGDVLLVVRFKKLYELFGADVIGKRP